LKTLPLKGLGAVALLRRVASRRRGRWDLSVVSAIVAHQCHFIIRVPRQSFTAVNAFWAAPAQEGVVTLAGTAKARR
jgi:hypothetical protein